MAEGVMADRVIEEGVVAEGGVVERVVCKTNNREMSRLKSNAIQGNVHCPAHIARTNSHFSLRT